MNPEPAPLDALAADVPLAAGLVLTVWDVLSVRHLLADAGVVVDVAWRWIGG